MLATAITIAQYGLDAETGRCDLSVALCRADAQRRSTRARRSRSLERRDREARSRWHRRSLDGRRACRVVDERANRRQERQPRADGGQFKNRPDTIYVRRPVTIEVYAPWNVASERGEWTGKWTEPDGALEIGGTYQAQWRKVDGRWLIQGELFVPTHCKGSTYCQRRP